MSEIGSITEYWLPGFKAGDESADFQLWNRLCQRVAALARETLRRSNVRCRMLDEEDIASKVLHRLCILREQNESKLDEILSSEDLWSFLILMISGKVKDEARWQRRRRRRVNQEVGESGFGSLEALKAGVHPLDVILQQDIPVDRDLMEREEKERLLDLLPNGPLRETAHLHLSGFTKGEIAQLLGVRRQTVSERLKRILRAWRLAKLVEEVDAFGNRSAMQSEIDRLIEVLPEETRRVAGLYLQGLSKRQVARALEVEEYVVDLELGFILACWREEYDGVETADASQR